MTHDEINDIVFLTIEAKLGPDVDFISSWVSQPTIEAIFEYGFTAGVATMRIAADNLRQFSSMPVGPLHAQWVVIPGGGRVLGFWRVHPRSCVSCGCTDTTPCLTNGQPCGWVSPTLDICTACSRPRRSIVDVATEAL